MHSVWVRCGGLTGGGEKKGAGERKRGRAREKGGGREKRGRAREKGRAVCAKLHMTKTTKARKGRGLGAV